MDAWSELSTERPVGMGEGYIPRSKIKQYGVEELGLDGDALEFFISVIRKTDDGYLSESGGGGKADPKMIDEVHIGDTAGVKNLLRRLSAPKSTKDRFTKKNPEHPK
jgi:hypothetical protein